MPASADKQVTFGDRTITLRYAIKSMAALQDHWGLTSFQEVGAKMGSLERQMSADDMVAIVWAGTRTHHPELSKDEVLDLVDSVGMDELQDVLTKAFDGAVDKGGGSKASARPPKRN